MFYDKFQALCIQRGISPSAAAQEMGFSNAAASGWKSGSKPRQTALQRVADYFGISADYFSDGPEPDTVAEDRERIKQLADGIPPEAVGHVRALLEMLDK